MVPLDGGISNLPIHNCKLQYYVIVYQSQQEEF